MQTAQGGNMSTHCEIGYYNKEKEKYRSVFCVCDGYPQWVGKILQDITDEEKIKAIVEGGNIMALFAGGKAERDYDILVRESEDERKFCFSTRLAFTDYAYLWKNNMWWAYALGSATVKIPLNDLFVLCNNTTSPIQVFNIFADKALDKAGFEPTHPDSDEKYDYFDYEKFGNKYYNIVTIVPDETLNADIIIQKREEEYTEYWNTQNITTERKRNDI